MQPTLVILAAGMASRYGSMKQTEGFGPSGETIMEYSIYDAIRSGFKKVVFIIRKEFAENFSEIVESKIKGRIEIAYVFQELSSFVDKSRIPAGRIKPWGTAHAVLCAKEAVNGPFAVINADDFYGRDAFERAYQFLITDCSDTVYSIIGYDLLKTLSEHGTVNRGVCKVDSKGNLLSIAERLNVKMTDGKIICDDNMEPRELPLKTWVSMNFWCFSPSVFSFSEKLFSQFVKENADNPKAEFFIPIVADKFINDGAGIIQVIPTSAQWFGVTYKEDAPQVRKSLYNLVENDEYPENLWR